jgi:predicted dehydrogenase
MSISRRQFLGTAAVSAGAVTYFLPFPKTHAADPIPTVMNTIRIGGIGVGNQGKGNLKAFVKQAIAVCDVDSKRLGEAAASVEKELKKAPQAEADYRKLLDNKAIDAVVVTTPDHWHALITIDACNAGKHVYCEKPLTLTVLEGRKMVEAARKNKVIVQTGSQQRSDDKFRLACELIRNGYLGAIKEVRVGIPGVNFSGPAVADSESPHELDYDRWLGPAPKRPYNAKRVHYLFRFFWDYSGGQLTNFGAHHLDITQWALGMDDSGPATIEGKARYHAGGWYEVPEWCEIVYTYANGIKVTCGQGQKNGVTFVGEKGELFVNRGQLTSTVSELLKTEFKSTDTRLQVSKNHHQNWLVSIRENKLPTCDVEIGHRSATVCHLGNIAVRTGRKITWDAKLETIQDDPEAAKMLITSYRPPYQLPA